MHRAPFFIVGHGIMLGLPFIPKHAAILPPADPQLEVRALDMLIEELEERVALGLFHLDDPDRVKRGHEDALASGLGMNADDRVDDVFINGVAGESLACSTACIFDRCRL